MCLYCLDEIRGEHHQHEAKMPKTRKRRPKTDLERQQDKAYHGTSSSSEEGCQDDGCSVCGGNYVEE
jgi:hypothetical protein